MPNEPGSQESGAGQVAYDPTTPFNPNMVPEDVRDKPIWATHSGKTIGDVFRQTANLESMMGGRVALPTEQSTPEQVTEFYGKLGVPSGVDGYNSELPALTGNNEWDPELISGYKKVFHEAKMTPKQVDLVLSAYATNVNQQLSSMVDGDIKARTETEVKLKQEWGINYDMNVAKAKAAANHVFGASGDSMWEANLADYNVVKSFANLGNQFAEHKLFGDQAPPKLGGLTVDEAKAEKAQILGDDNHPLKKAYWARSNEPEYGRQKEARDRVYQLNTIIANSQ